MSIKFELFKIEQKTIAWRCPFCNCTYHSDTRKIIDKGEHKTLCISCSQTFVAKPIIKEGEVLVETRKYKR